jgi:signal transduction histidine kinase/type II secretory pathway pseudopilin PulG
MVAPMRFFPNRTLVSIGIVVALGVILATLAVLQYQWSGEVSQAERERMQASLRTATAQFRQEFGRDLQQLGQSFQPDAEILANSDWQRFARSLTDSLATADRPLASTIYLWVADGETGPQLLKLEPEIRSFQPASWPADLEPVRARYARTFSSTTRLPTEVRPNSWTLISGAPLMIHPLVLFQPMAGPPSASTRFLGYLMIGLNLNVMQTELLPDLAQRYFGGPDGFVYHIAIVSGSSQGKVIYQSDPSLPPTAFAAPDARIPLLDDFRARMGRRGAGPGSDLRPPGPDDSRLPFAPPGRGRGRGGPMLLSGGDGADWELLVKHREGSLEAVVSGLRRRNLAISFGVLLLLACSIALIVAYTQRAQRLARLQMDFVAGVSHELRTPLAVICSAGDNLAEGVVADSNRQIQQYGELIRDEGWKLTGMVEQILQFASLRKGRRQYNLLPAPLDDIVEKTLEKALPMIQAAGFEVEKSIDPNLPLVNVDAQALAQCMQNLINNALKYSGESRWLAVRVLQSQEEKSPEVLLTIEDRGMGIGPADLPHIFDPFYRGGAATAAQIHGTGLGLCMAREAIAAMAGSISVKSAPGKGSAFTIHLPAFVPEAAKPAAAARPLQ